MLQLPENVRWGGVRPASSPELLPSMVDFMLADENRPTEILLIGESFRRVRFGAHLKAFNLALRNDNEQRRWVYDGGI